MKTYLLAFLFFIFPSVIFSQGESTSYPTEQRQDSLNMQLYKIISKYAKSNPSALIPKMEKLIAKGANPNGIVTITGTYRKPGTYIPIIKDFYKNKYREYSYKTTPFHAAVASDNTQIVGKLLDLGAKVNIPANEDDYPIKLAAYKQDKTMIFFLLNHGANIQHIDLSKMDDIDLIEQLVKRGADVSTIDWTFALNNKATLGRLVALNPTFKGVYFNFEELFENKTSFNFLMDKGMPVSVMNKGMMDCPLLFGAVRYGDVHQLNKIISTRKVNLNAECERYFEKTPLVIAIERENLEIIKILLEKGADPMQKDWTDKTAINQTVFSKNPEAICKLLIQYGADLEYAGYFGQTPLMHAVKLDEYIPALAYINLGANVNAMGKRGETPLSLAVEEESISMIKLLIEHGANPETKYKGKSLLQYAQDEELSPMVIEYLKSLN